jgi:hypothetical protein
MAVKRLESLRKTQAGARNVIGELSVLGTKIALEIPGYAAEISPEISKVA